MATFKWPMASGNCLVEFRLRFFLLPQPGKAIKGAKRVHLLFTRYAAKVNRVLLQKRIRPKNMPGKGIQKTHFDPFGSDVDFYSETGCFLVHHPPNVL